MLMWPNVFVLTCFDWLKLIILLSLFLSLFVSVREEKLSPFLSLHLKDSMACHRDPLFCVRKMKEKNEGKGVVLYTLVCHP